MARRARLQTASSSRKGSHLPRARPGFPFGLLCAKVNLLIKHPPCAVRCHTAKCKPPVSQGQGPRRKISRLHRPSEPQCAEMTEQGHGP